MRTSPMAMDATTPFPPAPRRRYAPIHPATIALLAGVFGLLLTPIALVAVASGVLGWRRGRRRSAAAGIGLGLLGLALIPLLRAGYWMPIRSFQQQQEQIERSTQDLLTFAAGICIYSVDHGMAPRRLVELHTIPHNELRNRLQYCRRQSRDPFNHYLYVRPATPLVTGQPVLLEDPAVYDGWLLLVSGPTGLTSVHRGAAARRLWAVAQELARRAEEQDRGITAAEWRRLGVEAERPTRQ